MSTVILDTITGKSTATTITIGSTPVVSASANSMTIRGEGSAQTSIQQGLAKMWCTHTQAGTYVLDDSFNVASIADNGTGETTVTFSNAPANANYSAILTAGSANNIRSIFNANNTTRVKVESYQISSNSTVADAADTCLAVFGDLA